MTKAINLVARLALVATLMACTAPSVHAQKDGHGAQQGSHGQVTETEFIENPPTPGPRVRFQRNDDVDRSGGYSSDSYDARNELNNAGTVRVNNLANLEALLNIVANGGEILGIANGFPMVLLSGILLTLPDRKKLALPIFLAGVLLLVGGLALPGLINMFVASARDAGMFK